MEFFILDTFDNYIDANLTLGRLKDEGISCWLQDENTATVNPFLTNAIGGIKLMVPAEEVYKAKKILNTINEIKKESLSCPYCGSLNIEYFSIQRNTSNIFSFILCRVFGSHAKGVHLAWHCYDCGKEFEEPAKLHPTGMYSEEE